MAKQRTKRASVTKTAPKTSAPRSSKRRVGGAGNTAFGRQRAVPATRSGRFFGAPVRQAISTAGTRAAYAKVEKANAKAAAASVREARAVERANAADERAKLKAKYEREISQPWGQVRGQKFAGAYFPTINRARGLRTRKDGSQDVVITSRVKRRFKTKDSAKKYVDKLGGVTLLSGAIALTAYGAMDYAGLSEAVPIQKYTAISLAGWLGVGALICARWVFSSPMIKDASYAVGLSLVAYEVTRQVGNRFVDWSNLFSGASLEQTNSQGWYMDRKVRRQLELQDRINRANGGAQAMNDAAIISAIARNGMQRAA